jgi:hypothetical protein
MFQLTPEYPKWLTNRLASALFSVLLLHLVLLIPESTPQWAEFLVESVYWILASCFAVITLRLQLQRRRRIPDATLSFFRLAMVSLLVSALFSLAAELASADSGVLRTLSAMVFLVGFAMSMIQGMLYKVVPFLVWFHLFRGGIKAMEANIPNMKEIIPEAWMWLHLYLQVTTLLAVMLSPWWDAAGMLVMVGLLIQGGILGLGLYTGIRVYRQTQRRIEQL